MEAEDPTVRKLQTDNAPPMRAKDLVDKFDPRDAKLKTEIDDILDVERTEIELPKLAKSITLSRETPNPQLAIAKTERLEPIRRKLRRDSEELMFKKSKTLAADPMRAKLRREKEDPKEVNPKIERCEQQFTKDLTERADPK
jgi:hypothetical protein